MYPDFIWVMYVEKSLMQRKAKISSFQSSVAKTYFSLGDLGYFKVMYSGQKLNYKDRISATHLQLPGVALWKTACVCQLSCPCPEPAQPYATAAPCAKQEQAVDTHPPVHMGTVQSSLPATSASLTHKLWQTRKHSPMQYPTVRGSPLPSTQWWL